MSTLNVMVKSSNMFSTYLCVYHNIGIKQIYHHANPLEWDKNIALI